MLQQLKRLICRIVGPDCIPSSFPDHLETNANYRCRRCGRGFRRFLPYKGYHEQAPNWEKSP